MERKGQEHGAMETTHKGSLQHCRVIIQPHPYKRDTAGRTRSGHVFVYNRSSSLNEGSLITIRLVALRPQKLSCTHSCQLSVCLYPPFLSTRPSDRNQILHTYSDRYGTHSVTATKQSCQLAAAPCTWMRRTEA